MKRMFLILGIFIAFLSVLTGCQDEAVPAIDGSQNAGQKTASAKSALKVLSNTQALERLGFGSPSVFNNQFGMTAGAGESGARSVSTARRAMSTNSLSTARTASDSTEVEDHEECDWTTCAEESFVENEDGSFTWTLDYGTDGCDENGYFMKGKMVETFVEDGNQFSGTIEYFDFGDEYSSQNGTETFSGTWEESGDEEDSTDWAYSGSYEYSENLEYSFTDEDVTEVYTVVATGKESYDENGFMSTEATFSYTSANGDFFNGSLSKPLFYSYACESESDDSWIFVPVSGEEAYSYKEGDESGDFSISYGDGTCDNIITITENGVSEDIDLGEEWEDEWDEDAAEDEISGS